MFTKHLISITLLIILHHAKVRMTGHIHITIPDTKTPSKYIPLSTQQVLNTTGMQVQIHHMILKNLHIQI